MHILLYGVELEIQLVEIGAKASGTRRLLKMKSTINYKLSQPEVTDSIQDTIQQLFTNFGTIDTALNKHDLELADIAIDVKEYGAKGDGVTDDTAAVQAAVNATGQGTLLFPVGIYIIKDVYLHDNITLMSLSSAVQYSNNNAPGVTLKAGTGATCVLNTTCSGISLVGIVIDGNNQLSDGVGSSGAYNQTFRNCRFANCNTGLGANYKDDYTGMMLTTYVDNCFFTVNKTGIDNLIDSKILNSFFVSNSYAGIRLFGSDNIVTGNKIEWNNYGIISFYGTHCTISNNIFDANNLTGITIGQWGGKTTIADNVFRRNGMTATSDKEMSHIDIELADSVVLSGNVTIYDQIDSKTGAFYPLHSVVMNSATNTMATGNDFTGCTGIQIVQNTSTNSQIDSVRLAKLENVTSNPCLSVPAVSNVYTLNLSIASSFVVETSDTTAKTITFLNVPSVANTITSISIILKFTKNAVIRFPNGTIWKDTSSPTFVVGKRYSLLFVSYDNGTSWLASSVGAW